MNANFLDLPDQLRAIAQLGLNYSRDPYDVERYRKLLDLAAGSYSAITGLDSGTIRERNGTRITGVRPGMRSGIGQA